MAFGGDDSWPKLPEREPDSTESPPVEQLLIAIGRDVRETNSHLRRLRYYAVVLIVLGACALLLLAAWVSGVVTIEFRSTR